MSGGHSQVAEAWPGEKLPPTRLENLILADSLARLGQERALTVLERCGDWWPASSAIIKATLANEQKNPELAASRLEEAFEALQTSPWETGSIINQGFRLALELGKADRQYALKLSAALEKPLALGFFESRRRILLFDLADMISPQSVEQVLSLWFEPYPLWTETFLSKRVAAYLATGNPLFGKATEEYERYMKATDLPVDTLLFLRGEKSGGQAAGSALNAGHNYLSFPKTRV